jgi:hypothetical protein
MGICLAAAADAADAAIVEILLLFVCREDSLCLFDSLWYDFVVDYCIEEANKK